MQKTVFNRILQIWWPLALSWLFMGLEQPLISAVIARLADPTIQLAALGIVLPIALLIESPIIMLLAASTALSDHQQAYKLMYRFMMTTSAIITILHALLVFTPLYDFVIVNLFNPPEAIIEPARLGLMMLLPWTWSIAYRRFHQGLLIRYGDAKAVSIGTLCRLIANIAAMSLMVFLNQPGIVVACIGISAGVLSEAVFIAWRAQPLIKKKLPHTQNDDLTWPAFTKFYIPLALTSLLLLGAQPLGSAALSRMPNALNSLAVWPVLVSVIFLFRGLGFAYNEVVVTALKEKQASFSDLQRFALILSVALTTLIGLMAFTPFAHSYFATIAGLNETLTELALSAFALAVVWPAISVLRNLYQGVLVFNKQTRYVTESVVASLMTTSLLLFLGVMLKSYSGVFVGLVAFITGNIVQVLWLVWRSHPIRSQLKLALNTRVV